MTIILCCQGHFLQPQPELILLSVQSLRMTAEGYDSMTSKQAELQCSMLYDRKSQALHAAGPAQFASCEY